jgi:hypothetical protein
MASLFFLLYACDGASMLVCTYGHTQGLHRLPIGSAQIQSNRSVVAWYCRHYTPVRPSLLAAFATALLLRWRLTFHILLEPFLSRLLLSKVGLPFAQNMLEPELCTFQIDFQMCHLSGVGIDTVALDVALSLGVSDGFVEHSSLKAVLRAAAVTGKQVQYMSSLCVGHELDLRSLKPTINDALCLE